MSRSLELHVRQEDSRYFRTSSLDLLSFPFLRLMAASQQVPESIYCVHGCKGGSAYHPRSLSPGKNLRCYLYKPSIRTRRVKVLVSASVREKYHCWAA